MCVYMYLKKPGIYIEHILMNDRPWKSTRLPIIRLFLYCISHTVEDHDGGLLKKAETTSIGFCKTKQGSHILTFYRRDAIKIYTME